MNEVSRYLTEEVVVDYADGLIPRREALNRLALLGVTAAAGPLLAAPIPPLPHLTKRWQDTGMGPDEVAAG